MGVALFSSEKYARLNRMRGEILLTNQWSLCINFGKIVHLLTEFPFLGFVPRPTRLDFDQSSSEGHPSAYEELQDKQRPLSVPTPPERGERRYKNNNHQDHHHVTKVPVGFTLHTITYSGEILS